MPDEAQDLRAQGVSFEEAMKRMITTPPPLSPKKAKAAIAKPKRKK
jgi:hypothetical protein